MWGVPTIWRSRRVFLVPRKILEGDMVLHLLEWTKFRQRDKTVVEGHLLEIFTCNGFCKVAKMECCKLAELWRGEAICRQGVFSYEGRKDGTLHLVASLGCGMKGALPWYSHWYLCLHSSLYRWNYFSSLAGVKKCPLCTKIPSPCFMVSLRNSIHTNLSKKKNNKNKK